MEQEVAWPVEAKGLALAIYVFHSIIVSLLLSFILDFSFPPPKNLYRINIMGTLPVFG